MVWYGKLAEASGSGNPSGSRPAPRAYDQSNHPIRDERQATRNAFAGAGLLRTPVMTAAEGSPVVTSASGRGAGVSAG